jgi:hypothetical protein
MLLVVQPLTYCIYGTMRRPVTTIMSLLHGRRAVPYLGRKLSRDAEAPDASDFRDQEARKTPLNPCVVPSRLPLWWLSSGRVRAQEGEASGAEEVGSMLRSLCMRRIRCL